MDITELGHEHIGKRIRVRLLNAERTVVEGTLSRVDHDAHIIEERTIAGTVSDYAVGRRYTTVRVGGLRVGPLGEDESTVEVLT